MPVRKKRTLAATLPTRQIPPAFFLFALLLAQLSSAQSPEPSDFSQASQTLAIHAFSSSQSYLQVERQDAPLSAILNLCNPYAKKESLIIPSGAPSGFSESLDLAAKAQNALVQSRDAAAPLDYATSLLQAGPSATTAASLLEKTAKKLEMIPRALAFSEFALIAGGVGIIIITAMQANECNQKAHDALEFASQSAQSALAAVEASATEFDQEYGDEELPGPASKAKTGLSRAQHSLAQKDANAENLGGAISRAEKLVQSINRKTLDDWNYWPSELPQAIPALVSREKSALSEAIALSREIAAGREWLANEKANLGAQAHAKTANSKNAVLQIEKKKLAAISQEALPFQSARAQVYATETTGSFYDRAEKARERLELAERQMENAEFLQKQNPKQRGFLAKQIILMREAIQNNEKAILESEKLEKDANELDASLEHALNEKTKSAESAVQARAQTPLGAFFATEFEKIKNSQKSIPEFPQGSRINSLAESIALLEEFQNEVEASAPNSQKIFRLKAKASAAQQLAKRALEDEIDAREELALLANITLALDSLSLFGAQSASAFLDYAESEITRAENAIAAKAASEYSLELEQQRASLGKLRDFLNARELEAFNSHSKLFPFGRLDAKKAAGSMKKIREEYNAILSRVEADSSAILEKHLENSLELQTSVDFVEPDKPATALTRIKAKNRLPLSGRFVELELPLSLPSQFRINYLQGDAEITRSPGGKATLSLSQIRDGGEVELQLEYEKIFARTISETTQTIFASEEKARKKLTLEIAADFSEEENAGRALQVIIAREFAYPAKFFAPTSPRIEKTQKTFGEKTALSIALQANPGKNAVELEYEIPMPFEKTVAITAYNETALGTNATFVKYDLRYENKFEELDSVKISFKEPSSCKALRVAATGDFKISRETLDGNALSARLEAGNWPAGQYKTAEILVECESLEQAIIDSAKMLELPSIAELAKSNPALAISLLENASSEARLQNSEALLARQLRSESEKLMRQAQNALSETQGTPVARELGKAMGVAESKIAVADLLLSDGKTSDAKREYKAASAELEKTLKENALQMVREADDACKNNSTPCPQAVSQKTRDARTAIEAGSFEKAFSLARQAGEELNESVRAEEKRFAEKLAMLEKFQKTRASISTLLEQSAKATEPPDASLGAKTASLAAAQDAVIARKNIEKKLAAVDALALQSQSQSEKTKTAFAKITPQEIQTALGELDAEAARLNNSLSDAWQKAREQVRLAGLLGEQYGSEADLQKISSSRKLLDEGKFLAAYSVASAVSSDLGKKISSAQTGLVVAEKPDGATTGGRELILGAMGVIALALLAFLFFKGQKPQRQKKQLDFE